mmetsp:Transcript_61125/g.138094  ORF Transcript_61125/g.138094 Transcript_61125/m.138094 type:complete len:676 (-) Transcript_61125:8-2035(-)
MADEAEDNAGDAEAEEQADVTANDASASLLELRSLLTPDGYGTEKPKAEKPKAKQEAEGPDWTSRYLVVDSTDFKSTPLEDFKHVIHPAVITALKKSDIYGFFPIQATVVPLLVRSAATSYNHDSPYNCDVCVAAPTGQGKTLAYAVPIVQALLHRRVRIPRAVVILPTRDLAMQVWKVFSTLCSGLPPEVSTVSALCLVGQRSFAEDVALLASSHPDIVVCTPGRLADHLFSEKGSGCFKSLQWVVADEADRLLAQSYHRWLDLLDRLSSVPSEGGETSYAHPPVQKLLFSATMTWNPQKLAALKLRRPLYFFSSKTGQYSTPSSLHQRYVTCKFRTKPLALLRVLRHMLKHGLGSSTSPTAIVFCSSVEDSHRLARLLEVLCLLPSIVTAEGDADEASAAAATGSSKRASAFIPEELRSVGSIMEFSSSLSQGQRNKLLKRFRAGKIRCLVCSDVVARGIDMPDVQVVVNYSVPANIQTYIHRSGRTARAGREGYAFTLLRDEQVDGFKGMLAESADCAERIQHEELPHKKPPEGWYTRALSLLTETLELERLGTLGATEVLQAGHLSSSARAMAAEETAAVAGDVDPTVVPVAKAKASKGAQDALREMRLKKKRGLKAMKPQKASATAVEQKEAAEGEPVAKAARFRNGKAKAGKPGATLYEFLHNASMLPR